MTSQENKRIVQDILTFWNAIDNRNQEKILNNTNEVKYKKGDTIHSGDQDCLGVLLIKSGRLRTYILSEDGREITLYRLRSGDACILSSSCILSNITFDVHIDADADSELLIVNSEVFAQIATENIYVENFSNKEAVSRFSDVMWAMQQILFMSFDKRLAFFIIDELSRIDGNEIVMTHEQISKYIGSAREVVSRMLKYFENEGVVELFRGGIRVKDLAKLNQIVNPQKNKIKKIF